MNESYWIPAIRKLSRCACEVALSASSTSPVRLDHGCAVWEAASMHQKRKAKRRSARTKLRLPDLDHSKNSVLQSLGSVASRRTYGAAIEDFITWYCSEPRLAFGRTSPNPKLKPLPPQGLVTDVPGPMCNACPGTLIPQEGLVPLVCAERRRSHLVVAVALRGGRCGRERPDRRGGRKSGPVPSPAHTGGRGRLPPTQ